MKSKILGLLAAALLAGPMAAHAALIQVDFSVSGGWFSSTTPPFDMAVSPALAGTMVVDNSQTGASALVDFSLTTGTKTWTENQFVGTTSAVFIFDAMGDLLRFGLEAFSDSDGFMYIYSDNSFSVYESASQESNNCNGCVRFTQRRVPEQVPEPGTLALLGLGLLGLGLTRRKAT